MIPFDLLDLHTMQWFFSADLIGPNILEVSKKQFT